MPKEAQREIYKTASSDKDYKHYSFCLGGWCLWVTFLHHRPLGCRGRPCPLVDLGDSRILRDGESISALDIFIDAPAQFWVCLSVCLVSILAPQGRE